MSIATEITRLQNAKAALKESIEAKGVTVEDIAKLDEYPALVDSIPQGSGGVEEKDVNFYDYDGTCVYSYTKDEFLALNEMPALPDHTDEGLVSECWNWSLTGAKTFINDMPGVDIGSVYKSDGTYMYINIEDTTLPFSLCLYKYQCNNDVFTIFWGDGESSEITATDESGALNNLLLHSYNSPGEYKIIIKATSISNYDYHQIRCPRTAINPTFPITGGINYSYNNKRIKKLFICKDSNNGFLALVARAFQNCINLKLLIINDSFVVSSSEGDIFTGCGLEYIVLVGNSNLSGLRNLFSSPVNPYLKGITFCNKSGNIDIKTIFSQGCYLIGFISFGEEFVNITDTMIGNSQPYPWVKRMTGVIKPGYNSVFSNTLFDNQFLFIKANTKKYSFSIMALNPCLKVEQNAVSNITYFGTQKLIVSPICDVLTIQATSGIYNRSLERLEVPDSVSELRFGNSGVQNEFSNLTSVFIYKNTPPSLTVGSGVKFRSDIIFYVPAESVEAYKTATNWSNYADKIFPIPTE